MYVDFAAFSLETVKERFSFKVILFVSTFKGIGPAFQKLLIYIKKLFRWSAQEKHSCLKLMVVWSKDTDCSTLLGLVLLQDVLEVVEELVLVDPPVVSERRGKCIEQGLKYHLLTHRQLQTNKPIQHRKKQTIASTIDHTCRGWWCRPASRRPRHTGQVSRRLPVQPIADECEQPVLINDFGCQLIGEKLVKTSGSANK